MSDYPDHAGHRGIDTSVAAADALAPDLGRMQRTVYGAISKAGAYGLTTDEAAAKLHMHRWCVQPRTSELRSKRLIADSGRRRKNVTGKLAIVWVSRAALDALERVEAA